MDRASMDGKLLDLAAKARIHSTVPKPSTGGCASPLPHRLALGILCLQHVQPVRRKGDPHPHPWLKLHQEMETVSYTHLTLPTKRIV